MQKISLVVLLIALFSGNQAEETLNQENPCVCTREYAPICGNDQMTYGNDCFFQCASIKKALIMVHRGSCEECLCDDHEAALCANNGYTYRNRCLFECAQTKDESLTIAYENECGCGCKDDSYHPLCTIDNREFYNFCDYECSGNNVEIISHTPCNDI